ncbi:hypothetical protein SDC9_97942 [bioreactor metagenome]|uniref:Uncharacterized protein n=1 Tax=bioreactor metagenome TaxID=1076179 RepID=A0A645ADB4_9ZZZZ
MAVNTVTIENIPIVTPKSERKVRNLSPLREPNAKIMLSDISLKITEILLYRLTIFLLLKDPVSFLGFLICQKHREVRVN